MHRIGNGDERHLHSLRHQIQAGIHFVENESVRRPLRQNARALSKRGFGEISEKIDRTLNRVNSRKLTQQVQPSPDFSRRECRLAETKEWYAGIPDDRLGVGKSYKNDFMSALLQLSGKSRHRIQVPRKWRT